jgi:hypothetical protein
MAQDNDRGIRPISISGKGSQGICQIPGEENAGKPNYERGQKGKSGQVQRTLSRRVFMQ